MNTAWLGVSGIIVVTPPAILSDSQSKSPATNAEVFKSPISPSVAMSPLALFEIFKIIKPIVLLDVASEFA